jgi:nucleoside-diphosphate-sugar epimerase
MEQGTISALATGAAGFIGYQTVKGLCREGLEVVGIDNLDDYSSVDPKHAGLEQLSRALISAPVCSVYVCSPQFVELLNVLEAAS